MSIDARRAACNRLRVTPAALLDLTPDQLLDLAEQASRRARDLLAVARVGAVVSAWSLAPRRSVLQDAEGDLLHLCSDGSWTQGGVPGHGDPTDRPHCGPWTVVELDVPDARRVD